MAKDGDYEALVELAAGLRATVIPLSRVLRTTDTRFTPTQLSVLGVIDRYQPISIGELAEREHLSPAMISRAVTALVDHGLVERVPHEGDRRISRVRVSDQGSTWITESRAQRHAWLAERLALFQENELEVIATAVELLDGLVAKVIE